ncbi:MAG TPA: hypothetical protein VMV93_06910 [Chloroflexota bacterium]|nr:hypothetical protein [Chloroflexota bacterium]
MRSHAATFFPAQVLALGLSAAGALAMTILIVTTDPNPERERLFALLSFVVAGGVTTALALVLSSRAKSPAADLGRAVRRGVLGGLAAAGAVFLQFNAALKPANLAFILLVLGVVELLFLSRRQHPG